MQGIRGGRHTALYGDEEELEPNDLEHARDLVRRLLDEVHRFLVEQRAALAGRLASPAARPD